jgi:hypothetical protein
MNRNRFLCEADKADRAPPAQARARSLQSLRFAAVSSRARARARVALPTLATFAPSLEPRDMCMLSTSPLVNPIRELGTAL